MQFGLVDVVLTNLCIYLYLASGTSDGDGRVPWLLRDPIAIQSGWAPAGVAVAAPGIAGRRLSGWLGGSFHLRPCPRYQ